MKQLFKLFILLLTLSACSSEDNGNEVKKTGGGLQDTVSIKLPEAGTLLAPEQQQYVMPLNEFSTNLYKLSAKNGSDFVMSPLSIALVLGMANGDKDGEGTKALASMLCMTEANGQTLNELFATIIKQTPTIDEQVTLEIANNLSHAPYAALNASHVDVLQKYYDASVFELDLNSQEGRDSVDHWCNEKTHGLIPKIAPTPTASLDFLFTNVIYLKAMWTKQFDKANTRRLYFIPEDGEQKMVSMMASLDTIGYYEQDSFQAIRLPFGNGKFGMTILLPRQQTKLNELTTQLSAEQLQALAFTEEAVDIHLPSFVSESTLEPLPILSQLGADKFIDSFNAAVIEMVQKAKIIVNEEGAEAAAATAMAIESEAIGDTNVPQPKIFNANHPFLYYISEKTTGTIFFIGQYCGQ